MPSICGCFSTRRQSKSDNGLVRRATSAATTGTGIVSYFTAEDRSSEFTDVSSETEQLNYRIPSRLDLKRHPSNLWWSQARVDVPHVVQDFGPNPTVLASTVKVIVMDRDETCEDKLERFVRTENQYIILTLIMGKKKIVSCGRVDELNAHIGIFMGENMCELRKRTQSLKLILNPANGTSLPWGMYGPKDSYSIADFFGAKNCTIERDANCIYITIDVYSKFIVRTLLPRLAFQPNRISDYLLVDSDAGIILTGFRIVCTDTFLALLNDRHRPSLGS
jgi:hypothetical protein